MNTKNVLSNKLFLHLPPHISLKIKERIKNKELRSLFLDTKSNVDFYSNDYLGFAASKSIYRKATKFIKSKHLKNGSTGSRLISGNTLLIEKIEAEIAAYHGSESALIFGSGYMANLGLASALPQHGEYILYDELIHASLRDGISLSKAKSYKFKHNSTTDLTRLLQKFEGIKYVFIESVYSMDGDSPDLKKIATICAKHNAYLIVDEAHAVGVFEKKGAGLVTSLLQKK